MQRKKTQYTYGGMNKDTAKTKHDPTFYYDASHIRLLATDSQSSGSISNEKGTLSLFSIPTLELKGQGDIQIEAVDFSITVLENTSTIIDLAEKIIYSEFSVISFEGTSFNNKTLTFDSGTATNSFIPYTYTIQADNGSTATGTININTTEFTSVDPGGSVSITEFSQCQVVPWAHGNGELEPGVVKKYYKVRGLLPSTTYNVDVATDFGQSQGQIKATLDSTTQTTTNQLGEITVRVLIDVYFMATTDTHTKVTYTIQINKDNTNVGSLTTTVKAADIYDNGNIFNVPSCTTRTFIGDNAE